MSDEMAPAPAATEAEASGKTNAVPVLPDEGVIRSYIQWLHDEDDPICDVLLWDDHPGHRGPTGDRRGRLSELLPELVRLNATGTAVGVRLAVFEGEGTDEENVARVLAVFQDSDRGTLPGVEGTMHSRGRQGDHRVHRLHKDDGKRFKDIKDVALRLAVRDRTDPATTLLNQTQRLPGSVNWKKPASPVLVTLVAPLPDRSWRLDDLAAKTTALDDEETKSYRVWYASQKLRDKLGGDEIPDFGTKKWGKAERVVRDWVTADRERTRLRRALHERLADEAVAEDAPKLAKDLGLEEIAAEQEPLVYALDKATAETWLGAAKPASFDATKDWTQTAVLAKLRFFCVTFGFDTAKPLPPQPWDKKTALRIAVEAEHWIAACERYRIAQMRIPTLSNNPGGGRWEASQVPKPEPFAFGSVPEDVLKAWSKTRKSAGSRWILTTFKVADFVRDTGILLGTGSYGTSTVYQINCPWADEHSGPSSPSTTSILHTPGEVPGFRCFRSCHQDKTIIDLVRHYADALSDYCEARSPSDAATSITVDDRNMTIPAGYRVTDAGLMLVRVTEAGEVEIPICPTPVYIIGLGRDVLSGQEQVELAWKRYGARRTLVAARRDIADRTKIVALADRGIPVTSENARDLVTWFAKFEEANPDLPKTSTTSVMGWTRCRQAFVVGDRVIGTPKEPVTFGTSDPGTADLAAGFVMRGNLAEWRDLFEEVVKSSPPAALAVYAAVAPILLELLDMPGFAVEYAGVTSTGKTTALRLAASVWGTPDEARRGSVLGTWKATRNAIERMAACRSHLPTILDDSKGAARPETVPQVVYDLVQGQGRGRATIHGLQQSGHWRTVVVTSGEEPSATMAGHRAGGASARTLLVWGSPFDGVPADRQKALVDQINGEVRTTYGHLGPACVERLIRGLEETKFDLRPVHAIEAERLFKSSPGSAVAGRMADSMAVLSLTGVLVHKVLQIEHIKPQAVIDACWQTIVGEAKTADVAKSALEIVFSTATAQRHRFWAIGKSGDAPHLGWGGRWDDAPDADLCITPEFLTQALRESRHDVNAVVRTWADRKWISVQGTDRRTKKVRLYDVLTNCYVIPAVIISEQVLDGGAVIDRKSEPAEDTGVEELLENLAATAALLRKKGVEPHPGVLRAPEPQSPTVRDHTTQAANRGNDDQGEGTDPESLAIFDELKKYVWPRFPPGVLEPPGPESSQEAFLDHRRRLLAYVKAHGKPIGQQA